MLPQLLLVLLGALALTIVSFRRGWQAPLVLAVTGAAVSFVPGLPRLELPPDVILSVVLPPLLFSTTTDFSWRGFLRRWRSITNLGVLLVVVTTAAVGALAAWAVPWLGLGTALVLAAVVSPPDAVTAVAIGGRLGLPTRVLTTLKGESLVNDAAALTLFSTATAAVAGTETVIGDPVLFFLFEAVGGVLVGAVLGRVVHAVRTRLWNPANMTALAVLTPFTAYAVAEALQTSGVLAVVAAGFALSRRSVRTVYATRIAERDVWNLLDVLLEAFVFAYLGLQFSFLLRDALGEGSGAAALAGAAAVVLAGVVAVRVAWVVGGGVLMRRVLRGRFSPGGRHYSPREDLVIAWTGMRGVVTLAAAAGIPERTASGEPFPHRADLQVLAFAVAVGTLLLQGSTLPRLIRRLRLEAPEEREWLEEQRRRARELASRTARAELTRARDEAGDPVERHVAELVLERAEQLAALRAAEGAETEGAAEGRRAGESGVALRRRMIRAQREALVSAQEEGRIAEEAVRESLEQLDLDEASLSHRSSPRL
ncbi:Na+/H+ antiporter [Kineococcus indalonis]|uniref:Na+/H+ antiporter n=1 Tax=Kineococcus indalonis TaxID=2696566 RepID=UPI00141256FA|nr:Na+/H+ antiporter [Kineococcus indalonis]NAZ86119.1 Na+/H+ antiporter [Kineococcus indalonis]